ncbi:MAG: hypothetical protein WA061_02155 [Microgenomates group bacterium]
MKVKIECELKINEKELSKDKKERERDIKSQIKWAKQRVQRGYDERISWSIDWYLNRMMPKWLKELRPVEGKTQGTPMEFFTDEECSTSDGISKEAEVRARDAWKKEIDIMISGFEAAQRLNDSWKPESEDSEDWKLFNAGFDSFKKYYFCLWD